MKTCAIIPSFNHHVVVREICDAFIRLQIDVIIINDGSALPCTQSLRKLAEENRKVTLLENSRNCGKGFSVCRGFRYAAQAGYTHAIQFDADGQHNLNDLSKCLSLSTLHQDSVIAAVRDPALMPKARRRGRSITDFWVNVNTLWAGISDSMCGFRAYPLTTVIELIESELVGQRMDFDTDILVKLCWAGAPIKQFESSVRYNTQEQSNFDLLGDNIRISAMHTRLFFGMLMRISRLLKRRSKVTLHTPKETRDNCSVNS